MEEIKNIYIDIDFCLVTLTKYINEIINWILELFNLLLKWKTEFLAFNLKVKKLTIIRALLYKNIISTMSAVLCNNSVSRFLAF